MVGIGLVCWLNRNMTDPDTRKGITLALCIGDAVGFIVTLLGQLAGLLNPLGWVNVVIWLLLALGLGYFRFVKPGATCAEPQSLPEQTCKEPGSPWLRRRSRSKGLVNL